MLVAIGIALPLLVALTIRRLRTLDERAAPQYLELLRGVDILEPLPDALLERLALSVEETSYAAGDVVIREGEIGDRFYVISDGEVEVAGKTLSAGASFGEVALLRDVPRTATVTALTDTVLCALEQDVFVAAVTGHATAASRAETRIASHLGRLDRALVAD
jgi:CRP-like cAMP-binding protein